MLDFQSTQCGVQSIDMSQCIRIDLGQKLKINVLFEPYESSLDLNIFNDFGLND